MHVTKRCRKENKSEQKDVDIGLAALNTMASASTNIPTIPTTHAADTVDGIRQSGHGAGKEDAQERTLEANPPFLSLSHT